MLLCHDPMLVWPAEDGGGWSSVSTAAPTPHGKEKDTFPEVVTRWMIRTTPNERKAKKKIKNIPKRIYVIKTSFGTEEIEIRKGKKGLPPATNTHTRTQSHTFCPVGSGMCSFVSGTAHTVVPMATFYTFSSLKICPHPRSLRHLRTCGLACITLSHILRLQKGLPQGMADMG